jgi:translocator protein
MKKSVFYSWAIAILSVSLCLAGGSIIGAITEPNASSWYLSLKKPIFTPPDYIFSIVWPILYVLMGISLFLFWKASIKKSQKKTAGYVLFYWQLALNFSWPIFFFLFESTFYSLLDLIALLIALVLTMMVFYRSSKIASYLLFPYFFWTIFALVLNMSFCQLNK